ncbi:MAG: anti-sigma factor family protein [Hyphomicrobiaceae bacterium]
MNAALTRAKRFMKGKMMRHLPGMITCVEFEEFIVSYLEGTLPEVELKKFEWHIRFCRECREYLVAYKKAIEAARASVSQGTAFTPAEIPQDLVDAILEARKKW